MKRKKPPKTRAGNRDAVKSPAVKTAGKTKVQRIPPTADAARDEGPRLIPLVDRSKEPSRMEHYLDLADTALGLNRGPKTGNS